MTITRKYHTIRIIVHTISPNIVFIPSGLIWQFGRFILNVHPFRQHIHLAEIEYLYNELNLKRARHQSSKHNSLFVNQPKLDQHFLERLFTAIHEERPEEEYYR